MTLRRHLIVLMLTTLLPALVIGAIGLWAFEREAQTVVEAGLLNNARALSLAIDGYIEASVSALEVLGAHLSSETVI